MSLFHDNAVLYLDHIGYLTPNLEAALADFLKLRGARLRRGPALNSTQNVRYAFIELTPGTTIELLSPAGAESPIAKLAERTAGPYHACYAVADLQAAIETALADGAKLIVAPIADPAFDDRRIAFVQHPVHGLVEWVEAAPDLSASHPAPAVVVSAPDTAAIGPRVDSILLRLFPALSEADVATATLDKTVGWDSMGHIQLAMELEQSFDVELPTETIAKITQRDAIVEELSKINRAKR